MRIIISLIKFAIFTISCAMVGAGAFIYYAKNIAPIATEPTLPTPGGYCISETRELGSPIISTQNPPTTATILGMDDAYLKSHQPKEAVEGYTSANAEAYLDEGVVKWGKIPINTVVYIIPNSEVGAAWKKIYYPSRDKNILLYVRPETVVEGKLKKPESVPAEASSPQAPACSEVPLSSGTLIEGRSDGLNTLYATAQDKDMFVRMKSDEFTVKIYVAAGRTETVNLPPGFYQATFVMGKKPSSCGGFLEDSEMKRDRAGVDLRDYSSPKTIRYDMASGLNGGDFEPITEEY